MSRHCNGLTMNSSRSDMSIGEKGRISQKLHSEIEWTIENIKQYERSRSYFTSPGFSILGSEWCLKMYPNFDYEWISLFLVRIDDSPLPKSVNFEFGAKLQNGTVSKMFGADAKNYNFVKKNSQDGYENFLNVPSDLDDLLTSGSLTLTCMIRKNDALDCSLGLIGLYDDLKNLFESEEGCDTMLKVQNNKFPVHKVILSSRSPVFKAMFQVEMKEKQTGVVEIDDCSATSFKDFLLFIYCGELESSCDNFELYKIAHKYQVKTLKKACAQRITKNFSVDNLLEIFVFGNRFEDDDLKCRCLEFFTENFDDIALTDKWKTLLKEDYTLADDLLTGMANSIRKRKKRKL